MSYLGLSPKLPVSERLMRSPRRKAILRSAVTEFLRDGFHRISTEGIAAGAGVAKQTIYSHFSSKAALIDAIDRECVVWPDTLTDFTYDPDACPSRTQVALPMSSWPC